MGRTFDHSSANYVSHTARNYGLNGLTEMSIAAWIRLTNFDNVVTLRAMCKDGSGAMQTYDSGIDTITNGFYVRLENNALVQNPIWSLSGALELNAWLRVMFTFKVNLGTVADGIIYVNGVSKPLTLAGSYTSAFTLDEISATAVVGNRIALNAPWWGSIAWPTIWNRQLTPEEVALDHVDPLAIQSGMVACAELCPDTDRISGENMTAIGTLPCIRHPDFKLFLNDDDTGDSFQFVEAQR